MSDEAVSPEVKLILVELRRIVSLLGSISADHRVMSHDIRVARENTDVIKARTFEPLPMAVEDTNGTGEQS